MKGINIRIDEWIIADGNYAHFTVGETSKFALTIEHIPDQIEPAQEKVCRLEPIEDNIYHITAKLFYLQERVAIVDTGDFCLYIDGLPEKYWASKKRSGKETIFILRPVYP